MNFQDILAAIAVVMNGLPQGLLALTYGFAAFPTAIAFGVGIIGMVAFNQIAPISFQAESIVLAGKLGDNRQERLNIVFFTGIVMTIIGVLGLLEPTIQFIGPAILQGMMAGVGITLCKVSIDMIKSNKMVGGTSLAIALLSYFISKDLVMTIVFCVFGSALLDNIINKNNVSNQVTDLKNEKFSLLKIKLTKKIIRNTLALVTLQIGGNIAYGSITGELAKTKVNVDFITIYSGIGDSVSALFGGGPVEAIISGTAVAPNPKMSGIIMMLILMVVLLLKILPRIAKYIKNETICGFLFILGAVIVFPSNIFAAVQADPAIAGVTSLVTALVDPFIGMLAGLVVKFILMIF
ncbi:NCS2 family permease [Microaceticoccus formicicus]|uniref:NCS2 family permease n=1 Tax=Microaceticoccus formicicus TaxID=3118105 RepID=UPI003CD0177E|nr:NCS2 family permease [Peptoniphilaceae bacterium AMB_02]